MWNPGLYLRCADVDCLGKGRGQFISQASRVALRKGPAWGTGQRLLLSFPVTLVLLVEKWVYQVCGPGLLRTQIDVVSVRGFSWLPSVYLLLTVR